MRIVYVSNSARIPSRDANSVHLMKMCSSYASMGHQVTLFVSKNMDKDLAALDIYSHYGVANNFKAVRQISVSKYQLIKSDSIFNSLGRGVAILTEENQLYVHVDHPFLMIEQAKYHEQRQ